ncbi:MAG: hypothetical protein WD231_00455 [Candidatus Woykebacteria bacterium]
MSSGESEGFPTEGMETEIPQETAEPVTDSERLRQGESVQLTGGNIKTVYREVNTGQPPFQAKFIRDGDNIWIGPLGKNHDEIAKDIGLRNPVDAGFFDTVSGRDTVSLLGVSQGYELPQNLGDRRRTIELMREMVKGQSLRVDDSRSFENLVYLK